MQAITANGGNCSSDLDEKGAAEISDVCIVYLKVKCSQEK
jgi:hypothetical protein